MAAVRKGLTALRISVAAAFTALVCASTMMFSIYVPATRGYFNIGETMIYTTALLFGPFFGAFAGGVGSMLADIFLGYSLYAPATLVIKACEGALVGFLSRKSIAVKSSARWRSFTSFIGVIVAVIIGYIGTTQYVGYVEASVGLPAAGYATVSFNIPHVFWIALAILAAFLISCIGFLYEPQFGWLILSVLTGGFVMVLGYFLYEWILFGPAALAEVPVNIGQLTVGLLVSLPLVKAVWRRLPYLREEFK
jgi:uncharacterized membrane protein